MFPMSPSNFVSLYEMFSDINHPFYIQKIDENNKYYRTYGKIILFNPTTLYPIVNPVTQTLEKNLDSISHIWKNYNTLIFPICESSSISEYKSNHMIALIVDIQMKKILLLDSRSFSIPTLSKTELIEKITLYFFEGFSFDRIYLMHQSIFDLISCCYFIFLIIYNIIKIGGNMSKFWKFFPEKNTLIQTSESFLKKYHIELMIEHLTKMIVLD